jgi:hypothetical protein
MSGGTLGAGLFIGSWASGRIVDAHATAGGHDGSRIWLVPSPGALAVFLLFAAVFRVPQAEAGAKVLTTL